MQRKLMRRWRRAHAVGLAALVGGVVTAAGIASAAAQDTHLDPRRAAMGLVACYEILQETFRYATVTQRFGLRADRDKVARAAALAAQAAGLSEQDKRRATDIGAQRLIGAAGANQGASLIGGCVQAAGQVDSLLGRRR